MLEQSPGLAIPPESYFPIRLLHTGRHRARGSVNVEWLLADLQMSEHFQRWGLERELVRERLLREGDLAWSDAMGHLYSLYAEAHGKTRYGDKTPWFVMYIPALSKLFPESRFLHVIRDGRDVSLALREASWGPSEMPELAQMWARRVHKGRHDGRRLPPDRYLEVRYEDLLDDPEGTLRGVSSFFELAFLPEMLEFQGRKPETLGVGDPGSHLNVTRGLQRGLRDWRTQMSQEDLVTFEIIAGAELERFGYARAVPRPPTAVGIRTRAAAGFTQAGTRLSRYARKAARVSARLPRRRRDTPTA